MVKRKFFTVFTVSGLIAVTLTGLLVPLIARAAPNERGSTEPTGEITYIDGFSSPFSYAEVFREDTENPGKITKTVYREKVLKMYSDDPDSDFPYVENGRKFELFTDTVVSMGDNFTNVMFNASDENEISSYKGLQYGVGGSRGMNNTLPGNLRNIKLGEIEVTRPGKLTVIAGVNNLDAPAGYPAGGGEDDLYPYNLGVSLKADITYGNTTKETLTRDENHPDMLPTGKTNEEFMEFITAANATESDKALVAETENGDFYIRSNDYEILETELSPGDFYQKGKKADISFMADCNYTPVTKEGEDREVFFARDADFYYSYTTYPVVVFTAGGASGLPGNEPFFAGMYKIGDTVNIPADVNGDGVTAPGFTAPEGKVFAGWKLAKPDDIYDGTVDLATVQGNTVCNSNAYVLNNSTDNIFVAQWLEDSGVQLTEISTFINTTEDKFPDGSYRIGIFDSAVPGTPLATETVTVTGGTVPPENDFHGEIRVKFTDLPEVSGAGYFIYMLDDGNIPITGEDYRTLNGRTFTVNSANNKNIVRNSITDVVEFTVSPARTTYTVSVDWQDKSEDTRPAGISVGLTKNGVNHKTAELSKNNGWTVTFDDLDMGFTYEIRDISAITGYSSGLTKENTQATIRNTLITPKTVKVEFGENIEPFEIKAKFIKNGEENGIILNKENGFEKKFDDVLYTDTVSTEIITDTPDTMVRNITGNDNEYKITYSPKPMEYQEYTVSAGFRTDNKKVPSAIKFTLYKAGMALSDGELKAPSWNYTFKELEKNTYTVGNVRILDGNGNEMPGFTFGTEPGNNSFIIKDVIYRDNKPSPTPTPTVTPTPAPKPSGDNGNNTGSQNRNTGNENDNNTGENSGSNTGNTQNAVTVNTPVQPVTVLPNKLPQTGNIGLSPWELVKMLFKLN